MGGKSAGSGGNQAVEEQKKQAAEARKKEEERKARIGEGMTSIKQAFEGAPVMGTQSQAFDWSKFAPPAGKLTRDASGALVQPTATGVPAGFTAVQVADPNYKPPSAIAGMGRGGTIAGSSAPRYPRNPSMNDTVQGDSSKDAPRFAGGNYSGADAAGGGGAGGRAPMVWAMKGPDGKLYYQGQGFNYDSQIDTGKTTGGFDDGFYDKYKQGILDYYTPQVADQYGDAKDELTYRLARAGTLRSSVAAEQVADLSKQNDLNMASVLNKADQGAADLRSNVASQRAKVESQLLASEDPNAAASQALAAVKNISLDQPEMSPLGMIFNLGTIGAANALRGYQSKTAFNQFNGANPTGAQRIIGS